MCGWCSSESDGNKSRGVVHRARQGPFAGQRSHRWLSTEVWSDSFHLQLIFRDHDYFPYSSALSDVLSLVLRGFRSKRVGAVGKGPEVLRAHTG